VSRARLSRGTPYILTATEVEETLKHLPPRIELAVAALMNMTVDDWRKQESKLRVKQIVDYQNAGSVAATLAASARAIGDLEAAALPAIHPVENTDTLIDQVIDGLHRRGLVVMNPVTAKKGA